jgi:phosphatidate cytidylyltransferase
VPGQDRPPLNPLLVRIASAAVLVVIIIGLLALGQAGMYALVVLVAALALWEFRRLSGLMGYRAPMWLLFPLGFYFALSGTQLANVPVQIVLAVALVGGLSPFLFLPGRRQGLGRWAMGLAGAVYIGVPLNYYLLLYQVGGGRGLPLVIITVLTVIVGDVSALLIGMWRGRHPFFPSISPRKTWEGAVGGVLLCVPVFVIGSLTVLHLPWYHGVVLGLLVGASGVIGDLVESQMKRLARVKDSSNLIPGHGGVLDRVDSALFAPIVVYLYGTLLHLLR